MGWLEAIFAFIKMIPILDRWFANASQVYWDWKYQKNAKEIAEAFDKAEKEYDTTDLQKEIGEKL